MGDSDFDGIFVDGKPLDVRLVDDERDDKSREIEALRKEAEHKQKISVVYSSERQRPDTRRVARRVKRLSDRQIRKEYGIMAKPFKENSHNIIWAIIEKGPLTVREISAEIEWEGKYNTLSAAVATVWARLGNKHEKAAGILTRHKEGMSHYYQKARGVDVSVEAAIEKYRLVGTAAYRRKIMAQDSLPQKPANNSLDKINAALAESVTTEAHIRESDKNTAPPLEIKNLFKNPVALQVMVSGQVEIIFKLG